MEFYYYELQQTIKAKTRPIVIITLTMKRIARCFLRRFFPLYPLPGKKL